MIQLIYAVNVKKLIKGLRDYGPLDDDISTILKLIDSFFNRFQLKAERIQNTSSNIDILQRGIMIIGMTMNSTAMQVWYDACAKVVLVQPSSGGWASERVFSSLLSNSGETND